MSDRTWRFSLDNFPKHAPRVFEQLCRAVQVEAVHELSRRWLPYAQAISPIGGTLSRRRKDRAPGAMKRGWKWTATGKGFGRLSNAEAHAHIIDRGRKKGVTPIGASRRVRAKRGQKLKPNARARMLGSIQAPRGVTRPVWQRLNKSERAEISKIAISKAEASVPTGGAS